MMVESLHHVQPTTCFELGGLFEVHPENRAAEACTEPVPFLSCGSGWSRSFGPCCMWVLLMARTHLQATAGQGRTRRFSLGRGEIGGAIHVTMWLGQTGIPPKHRLEHRLGRCPFRTPDGRRPRRLSKKERSRAGRHTWRAGLELPRAGLESCDRFTAATRPTCPTKLPYASHCYLLLNEIEATSGFVILAFVGL